MPGAGPLDKVPSLRGRIVKIGGKPVERDRGAVRRALGGRGRSRRDLFSDAARGLADRRRRMVAGRLSRAAAHLVRREPGQRFGLGLGDSITVNVLGRDIEAKIASLRRIEWTTLAINFVFVYSPGTLDKAPHTFLATVKSTPEAEDAIFKAVTDQFPNVTVVRIRDAVETAAGVLGNIGLASRVIGFLSILAGVLVLAGAMLATQRRRVHEAVVMKVLGATRARIAGTFAWEFAFLGLATAMAALGVGTLAAYLVVRRLMNLEWTFLPIVAVGGRRGRHGAHPGVRPRGDFGGIAAAAACLVAQRVTNRSRGGSKLESRSASWLLIQSRCDPRLPVEGARQTRPPWRLETKWQIRTSTPSTAPAQLPTRRRSMSVCAPTWCASTITWLRGSLCRASWPSACSARAELAGLFFQLQGGRVVGLNMLGWIAIFAPLGLLLLTSFRAAQMSTGAVQAVYWAVTALMGVSLSLLLFRYTGASVARTFFVTAAAFGALSLYGYTTKRDLTAMGKFLFMGVIGLILAGLVNMFWPSGTMSFIISAAGVLIFSGLIAYDTQRIKEQYAEAWGTDMHEKVAVFGALACTSTS